MFHESFFDGRQGFGIHGEEQDSPSLTSSRFPAFELKFLLSEPQAREIQNRLSGRLVPDRHSSPELGYAYQTTSLYCDTAGLDVFHRRGSFKRCKHRLRRYLQEPWLYLERKIKWGDRVKKRRARIPEDDLAKFHAGPLESSWCGHWFHRHVQGRKLLPACTITYERAALVGLSREGPLRVTFDRRIRGIMTGQWRVSPVEEGIGLLGDRVICEFKYQVNLPALFKEIIQAMQLVPRPVSKYRTLLRAAGHVDGRPADAGVA